MVNKTTVTCPQCLHINPAGTKVCELCDWSLVDQQGEQTVMPGQSAHPDQTFATAGKPPNEVHHDPDQTIAPGQSTEQTPKPQSLGEQQTFLLAGDLAHFEVLEILGQGGMGAVYHAQDKTLQRDVALKLLRPMAFISQANAAALLDEARMASKLNHPNIVTIYDVARAKDSNYIVMEWVNGKPLSEKIEADGMPVELAMKYARQMAEGLASAHQNYIIHRDIKPQNIMLTEDDNIKILDFGIAGLMHQMNEINDEINASDTVIGTPSYMSPEQARGMNLDQRSDIFSLGVVLYEMITGQRPFQGPSAVRITKSICAGEFTPVEQLKPDLPPRVVALVNKMLATQRDERWQSSSELAAEIQSIHSELTYRKNWWQRQHWLTRAAMLLPFIIALGWTTKDILFPASTQELIEQQLAEATKVAILPFDNISGDPLLQIFGDGLAVNLSTDLTKVASEMGETWIVPATEISRMPEVTPKSVADKYGVELILTGSMQHMGSTRLMVLNLLDAQSGQQLKTTELSIDAEDLFGGHSLIREQAMELLGWPMSDSLNAKFNAQRPQLDGAYKHYVEGRGYLYRYDQEGNLDNAMKSFKYALELEKGYIAALVGLAEVYQQQFLKTQDSDWLNDMLEIINELQVVDSTNHSINFLSAKLETNRGNFDLAATLYEKSINSNPSHLASYVGLANAISQSGDINDATEAYENAYNLAPNNWRVISEFGIFYYQHGMYKQAYSKFNRMVKLSPNNHYAYRALAASQYGMGDLEGAIENTQKAIDILPTDEAYSNLGAMLFSIKKYEESVTAFTKAIEIKSTEYLNWGNLADAYKVINDKKTEESFKRAAELAKKSLSINPNNSFTKACLSYYLANLGEFGQALKLAEQIGSENNGIENYMVALSYDVMNLTDKALEHLLWAIDKNYPRAEIIDSPLLSNLNKNAEFKRSIKGS